MNTSELVTDQVPLDVTHLLLVTGSRSWNDRDRMVLTFRQVLRSWSQHGPVARPVLLSGGCNRGTDAMAEHLWLDVGLPVVRVEADWARLGRRAGPARNQRMVNIAVRLNHTNGTEVTCTAFWRRCANPGCRNRNVEQLTTEGIAGHWSHGTTDCRRRAVAAGLDVVDVW